MTIRILRGRINRLLTSHIRLRYLNPTQIDINWAPLKGGVVRLDFINLSTFYIEGIIQFLSTTVVILVTAPKNGANCYINAGTITPIECLEGWNLDGKCSIPLQMIWNRRKVRLQFQEITLTI